MKKEFISSLLLLGIMGWGLAPQPALANHCWHDHHGHMHCDNGLHKGWEKQHHYYDHGSMFDTKTGKILKGGLLGAGIGAGTGILLDKPVGKSALLGAGIGSGVQAVRYSDTLHNHPIVRTAAYGALAGAGASQLSHHEGSLTKGALWGAAIGTGVGAFKHSDF